MTSSLDISIEVPDLLGDVNFPGSAPFTMESARVWFLWKQSWGEVEERVTSSCMRDQCLFIRCDKDVSRW